MSVLSGGAMLVVGIVIIIIGGIFVRKAHPTSGYLFMTAGAVVVLFRCCLGGASPDSLVEAGLDYDVVNIVMLIKAVVGASHLLLVGVLFAASFVLLSKQVPKDAG